MTSIFHQYKNLQYTRLIFSGELILRLKIYTHLAMTLTSCISILWLQKISAISSETEESGVSFMTRILQLRFREFGAPIIYMIPVP